MACRGCRRSFVWLADSLWTWWFFLIQSYCGQWFLTPLSQGQVSVFKSGTIYWTASISPFPNSIGFLRKTVHNRISDTLPKSTLFYFFPDTQFAFLDIPTREMLMELLWRHFIDLGVIQPGERAVLGPSWWSKHAVSKLKSSYGTPASQLVKIWWQDQFFLSSD